MYQLTIDSARTGTAVTAHTDLPTARMALQRYAVNADVYLQMSQATEPHSSYDLVELAERPHTTGSAVIEHMPAAAEAVYYYAGEARRWIDQHRSEPTGYAAEVLAQARAAATNHAAARILWHEAASLAAVEPAPDVDPVILDDVAQHALTAAQPLSTAHLAGIAAAADTTQPAAAVLTWWLALLTWGGSPS